MLLMGKSTISMAIFNSYVCLPEGTGLFAGLFSRLWARNLTIFSDHLPRFTNPVKNTILWGQIPLTVGIEIYHPIFLMVDSYSLLVIHNIYIYISQNSGMDHQRFGMDRGYGSACGFRVWIGLYILTCSIAATMRGPQDRVQLVYN